MKQQFTVKSIAAYALGMGATAVFAHDGHGLTGMHWHASDAWGFVSLATMIALAIWLSRK